MTAVDRDTSALCGSVNDPHMTTFDGKTYDNFFEGEFLLYRSQTYPAEVNMSKILHNGVYSIIIADR